MGIGRRYKSDVHEYCVYSLNSYRGYKRIMDRGQVTLSKGIDTGNATNEALSTGLENSLYLDRIEPLEAIIKEQLERAFDTDFSKVRIHTGLAADEMTRQAGAEAVTIGQDIYFAGGLYNPFSKDGIKLLVHELQHIQQYQKGLRMVFLEDIDELETQAYRVEEMMETHGLHHITQPLTDDDGPLLSPADQSRSLSEAAMMKRSTNGAGGSIEEFRQRQEAKIRLHMGSGGNSYVITRIEKEAIIESACSKVQGYICENSRILSGKQREEFLMSYLDLLEGRSYQ